MLALQPDPAGPSDMDTVAPSGCKTWVDICFEHLCLHGLVDFVFLIRWCRVSREWMDALKRAVRLMQQVSLPGGVTGEEALRALGLVAGGNVRFLRLRQQEFDPRRHRGDSASPSGNMPCCDGGGRDGVQG